MGEALIVRRGGSGNVITETITHWTPLSSGASLGQRFSINLAGRSLIGIGEVRIKGSKAFSISSSEITLDFDAQELYLYLVTSGYTSTATFDIEVDLLFADSTGESTYSLYRDNSWTYTLPKYTLSAGTMYTFK